VRLCLLALSRRAALSALALLWTSFASAAPPEAFVLVRSAKNANVALTRAQIRDMALGRRRAWPHGPVALLVLTRPGTPELRWFAASIVGLPESAWLARIKEQVFKGEMRKPVTAATEQDVLTAVAAEEGAIGVVRSELTRNLPSGVVLLSVM
jgi:hypothetical protein